jgi:hypothetical protein
MRSVNTGAIGTRLDIHIQTERKMMSLELCDSQKDFFCHFKDTVEQVTEFIFLLKNKI